MSNAKPTDWTTESLPPRRVSILLDRTYSLEEMARIRKGLVPEQMEDKWFIYWKDGALFFHRSWTGFCIYIVHFAAEGDGWKMFQADVNRDPEQYTETSDEKDTATIYYLVDVLLLHRDVDFPSNASSPEKSALMNWSLAGRAMLGEHPNDENIAKQDAPTDTEPRY